MTNFFNDLFQSLNIPLVLTAQQSLETIKAVNPSYNGTVSRDELFSTFKVLLGYESMPVQQQTIQQPTNMTPNYGGYQMMNNGGYMTMPNYVNVGSNNNTNLRWFRPWSRLYDEPQHDASRPAAIPQWFRSRLYCRVSKYE